MVYKFGHFPTAVDSCSLRYCGAGEGGKWHINHLWTDDYLSAKGGEGGRGGEQGWIWLWPLLSLYNILMIPLSLSVDWQAIFFSPLPL